MLGVAQDYMARFNLPSPPTFADVVFQCSFDGVPGATTAIDESVVNAPLTFHGAAAINDISVFLPLNGFQALGVAAPGDYVSAPHNILYDQLCERDFTIEFWQWTQIVPLAGVTQWVGVWEENDPTQQVWRVGYDQDKIVFQYRQGGITKLIYKLIDPGFFQTGVWYWRAFQRVGNALWFYIYRQGASTPFGGVYFTTTLEGTFDLPSGSPPLRIGGGVSSVTAFMQMVRLTKKAWYPGQNNPLVQIYPWGHIRPPFVVDADVIFAPKLGIGKMFPQLVIDQDIIFPPRVSYTQTLLPSLVVDEDNFFGPTTPEFEPSFPRITGGRYPTFVNDAYVESPLSTSTATLELPTGLVNGNLLVAYIHVEQGLRRFSPRSGLAPDGWFYDGFEDTCGNGTFAWRMVDGTETAPTFTWTGGKSAWSGNIMQFTDVSGEIFGIPIYTSTRTCGVSSDANNERFPFEVFTVPSLYIAIVVTNTAQVMTVPTGPGDYFQITQHNAVQGSSMVIGYNLASYNGPPAATVGRITVALDVPNRWTVLSLGIIGFDDNFF